MGIRVWKKDVHLIATDLKQVVGIDSHIDRKVFCACSSIHKQADPPVAWIRTPRFEIAMRIFLIGWDALEKQ